MCRTVLESRPTHFTKGKIINLLDLIEKFTGYRISWSWTLPTFSRKNDESITENKDSSEVGKPRYDVKGGKDE
jgi:hypothetical protein